MAPGATTAHGIGMVGVDVTLAIRLTPDDLAHAMGATSPHGRLLARALPQYVGFHAAQFGPQTCCAHDVMAAAVLTDPEVVTRWAQGEVRVIDTGAGSRAVLEPRHGGRSRAVAEMDGREVIDRLLRVLE